MKCELFKLHNVHSVVLHTACDNLHPQAIFVSVANFTNVHWTLRPPLWLAWSHKTRAAYLQEYFGATNRTAGLRGP